MPDDKPPLENVDEILGTFQDLFGNLFGGKRGARGNDIIQPLKLSYVEARDGTRRTLEVERRVRCDACRATPHQPCGACSGTGRVQRRQGLSSIATVCAACAGTGGVATTACAACQQGLGTEKSTLDVTVPPGMKPGMKLRLLEKGDEHPNGPPGHLFLDIVIDTIEVLVRDGDDVTFEAEVPMRCAVAGGTLEVDTLDGRTLIHVPRFVRDGAVVTLAGKGHARALASAGDPYRGEIGRGDQRVILRLSRETQLRRRQLVASTVAFFVAVAIAIALLALL